MNTYAFNDGFKLLRRDMLPGVWMSKPAVIDDKFRVIFCCDGTGYDRSSDGLNLLLSCERHALPPNALADIYLRYHR